METGLGAQIAALRRAQGLTQGQLAEAVGVSPPAVSKWETDKSCPDIALLCPLARALGTDVDTLLQFEEKLSEERALQLGNEVLELARTGDSAQAERLLEERLHQYPSNATLMYYAAIAFTMFGMFDPKAGEDEKLRWRRRKKELLEAVRRDRESAYWQQAALQLATLATLDGELEEAEASLRTLPEHALDTTIAWVELHLKRGETEEALKTVQKRLYILIRQVESCLMLRVREELEPDAQRARAIAEIYRGVEALFGCSGGMYEGFCAELYKRDGSVREERESMTRFIEAYAGEAASPNPLLFAPGVQIAPGQPAATREMREMLLKGIEQDAQCTTFLEDDRFRAAVEKLRASL